MEIEELYKLYKKCQGVTTDSRNITEGAMFFALKGEKFDGNDFAMKALEAGARYAIVDRPSLDGANIKGRRYCIVVENVLETLQKLAAYHREQSDIPVVGITGTNGKTTTKELVNAVLSAKYNTVATGGNLNNHIGVPLSLLRINDKTEMAVIEMGASAPGEIAALVKIAKPTCGIVTNVGRAHLLGFGSFDGVKKTKGELYDFLRQKGGTVFYNADNPILCEMVSSRNGLVARKYGVATEGASILPATLEEPFLRLQLPGGGPVVNTRLIGAYNADNVMAALCIARHFEVPEKAAIEAIEAYQPSNDRSQMVQTERNTLIVDTYNANPTSMNAALDNFAASVFENKTLILGDMLELGEVSLTEHVDVLDKARRFADSIILVGEEFSKAARGVDSVSCFHDVDALSNYLEQHPLSGRTILIKGSHGIHLEKLVKSL
ncbi:MAG: UDP-N-acetylmuramoyl-tripeptide--D-alanyl-D-alanine ligase [Bacteroidales bacterium]|nr:UDP-N-acetylmuramoyl-tripeptide--D-alanyl-D-alanine ligase [Bacteroidales bacterium]